VADLRHFATHLWDAGLVAGHVWKCAHLIADGADTVVVVERKVGAFSTPEAPGIDNVM
jgi:hypothetical protein